MANRTWIVGNSPDCDLRVEAPTVSAQHCRLTERSDGFLLEDLGSSNGTYVEGQRISSPTIVRRDNSVTLGRTIAIPWPTLSTSITIGRSAHNDLVIDFDAVSGTHARLEREGNQYYLVDLGSTNGTAIHSPSNKVTRAQLSPADAVFFGTHRVSAAELIACLPRDIPRPATVIESSPLEHSIFKSDESPGEDSLAGASFTLPESFRSAKSWLAGIAISVLCVCIIFGSKLFFGRGADAQSSSPPKSIASSGANEETEPTDSPAAVSTSAASVDLSARPDEKVVRAAEPSLGLLGYRFGGSEAYLTQVTAWSCRPNYVLCRTKELMELDEFQKDANQSKVDEAVSIFLPERQIAILDYQVGKGPAEGFSLAKLEAPLDATCEFDSDNPANVVPGQQLAMLSLRAIVEHTPDSVECEFVRLTVDRIERELDDAPRLLHCRSEKAPDDVSGAPVFDAGGNLVGCVISAQPEVIVMPIARLASLIETNP